MPERFSGTDILALARDIVRLLETAERLDEHSGEQRAALELDEVYADRNRLVLLAATMAAEAGYPVGLIDDPDEPAWPVVAIGLPQGQVSWHVPAALVAQVGVHVRAGWPRLTWDGHTNEQKAERVMAWCGRDG